MVAHREKRHALRALPLVALLVSLLGRPGSVRAQTDEIQVYDGRIAAPGQLNLTWHNNFTPQGRANPDFPGGVVPDHALNGVPEWALGIRPWLELGVYLPVYTYTGAGSLVFDSAKLRALFVVPDAGERPWFYGVNVELSYNAPHWEMHRYSGEIRPIVGVHLGRYTLIFNPILDTGFDGIGDLDFAPAVRAACEINGQWSVALEHYADFGPLRHFAAGPQQGQTVFAVADYTHGATGYEFGIGHGLTQASDAAVLKLMVSRDL
jgi:hypothetical protein